MGLYKLRNGPMATTAAFAGVTTGTSIKTMLQVKLGATINGIARVVEWGWSGNGSAAATPGKVELITTAAIKATITEFVAADIINMLDPAPGVAITDDNPFAFGAGGDESGYTATAEGSITTTRSLAEHYIAPTTQYSWQFPLGREPTFNASEFLRIRNHFGAAIDATCYVVVEV